MPRRRVLVTGSTGLLGSSLALRLAGSGFEVIRHGFSLRGDVTADLTEPLGTPAFLDGLRPEIIVNLVGLTDVDRCEREPDLARKLNVDVAGNLARWCAKRGTARLVHLSTDQVYSGPGPHGEAVTSPVNVYGKSKLEGERLALEAQSTVLRTNFFGRSQAAHRQSLSDWMLKSLREKASVTFFTDSWFSPLRMPTLCEAILRVLEEPRSGVFNLGSRNGLSKYDFGAALAEEFGLSLSAARAGLSRDIPGRALRPKDMRMDVARFEREFGFVLPDLRSEIQALRGDYEAHAAA